MSPDIFVPQSSPDDALVGQLHMVTYITADKQTVEKIFTEGYGLERSEWQRPIAGELADMNSYLGFDASHSWECCVFNKSGIGANVQIRVIAVDQQVSQVRPAYDGLYAGGATISFPIEDLHAHERHMASLGVESTIGVKEMEFTSPTGETYISAEIVYKAPENIFVMGVVRPDIFVPVGPVDPATGMGGSAYSARCITATEEMLDFLRNILGFEIRRDVEFTVGERSALLMPEGTTERFIQAFSPGSATGYMVLMDHHKATKISSARGYGPPNRGIGIWSFGTKNIDAVHRRAVEAGIEVFQSPAIYHIPCLPESKSMILIDPDGFSIEIFEATDSI